MIQLTHDASQNGLRVGGKTMGNIDRPQPQSPFSARHLWFVPVLFGVLTYVESHSIQQAVAFGVFMAIGYYGLTALEKHTARHYPNHKSTWRSWTMATLAVFGLIAALVGVCWIILKLKGAL